MGGYTPPEAFHEQKTPTRPSQWGCTQHGYVYGYISEHFTEIVDFIGIIFAFQFYIFKSWFMQFCCTFHCSELSLPTCNLPICDQYFIFDTTLHNTINPFRNEFLSLISHLSNIWRYTYDAMVAYAAYWYLNIFLVCQYLRLRYLIWWLDHIWKQYSMSTNKVFPQVSARSFIYNAWWSKVTKCKCMVQRHYHNIYNTYTRSHPHHYNDVIRSATVSQITSLMIVYSIVYSSADQRKHQSWPL